MSEQADARGSPAVRRATTIILPPIIKAVMKRDWHGREHIPRDGGVIISPNHLSYADWAAVALFTYEAGRYPLFLIKSSAFDVKLLGPFLRACGQLPVHRDRGDAALVVKELKDAEASLRAGGCLIVYPEGTASRDPDLWPMVGKTGAARLALTTGAPVIPVAHWGAQVILPYGSTRPHLFPRHLVRMLAGPPVDLSAYQGQPLGREVLRGATAAIMADITGLLAQLRGKEPPAVPFDPAARRAKAGQDGQAGPPGSHAEPPGSQAEPAGGQSDPRGGHPDSPGGQSEPAGSRTEPPGDGPSRKAAPT
jgi:1-acyl-sn-glycerol-3-phosphate acyltransferase